MSRIYWDTMLFIYLLEAHPEYGPRVKEILAGMARRQDTLCTSALAVGEILTAPYKLGARETAVRIRDFMRPPRVEILPFTTEAAERYAQIRAGNQVSPPDAVHLASAANAGVDLFLTNDRRLHKLTVPGIHFIAGMDVNIF